MSSRKRPAILCDLDGTLALLGGRDPYDTAACERDLLCQPVYRTVWALRAAGYRCLIVSGRFEQYREATTRWLRAHGVPYVGLYLRPDGDTRPDAVVKREQYERQIAPYYTVLLSLDDRDSSVAGWRALGIPCFQVAPGNF